MVLGCVIPWCRALSSRVDDAAAHSFTDGVVGSSPAPSALEMTEERLLLPRRMAFMALKVASAAISSCGSRRASIPSATHCVRQACPLTYQSRMLDGQSSHQSPRDSQKPCCREPCGLQARSCRESMNPWWCCRGSFALVGHGAEALMVFALQPGQQPDLSCWPGALRTSWQHIRSLKLKLYPVLRAPWTWAAVSEARCPCRHVLGSMMVSTMWQWSLASCFHLELGQYCGAWIP
jgi:hypothetical protein